MFFIIWIFITCIILFAFLVIITKNAVTSVLFLIGVYILTSFIFMILGAEFLSIILIIIYVGAVAILFIFVIMMLNIRVVEVYNTLINYLPIGVFIAGFYFTGILYMIHSDFGFNTHYIGSLIYTANWTSEISQKPSLYWLAELLYNDYFYLLWMAGLLLLLAMIGAITLTIDVESRDTFANAKLKYSHAHRIKTTISFWGQESKKHIN